MGRILIGFLIAVSAICIGLTIQFGDIPWGDESCSSEQADCPDRWFSISYLEARNKFRRAARKIGCEHTAESVLVDDYTGLDLTIDFAVLRGNDEKLLVHVSGTHGVEGYAGSAIQHKVLDNLAAEGLNGARWGESRENPTVVFVHALNPYGMAMNRRFNHNNVDLNRNCLSESEWKEVLARKPNIAHYDDLRSVLHPEVPPTLPNIVHHILVNVPRTLAAFGYTAAKRALVSGQYHDPQGVYYGGLKQEKNFDILFNFLRKFQTTAKKVVSVDVHSGLGPSGVDTMLVDTVKSLKIAEKIAAGKREVECAKCPNQGYSDAHAGYELQKGSTNASLAFPDAEVADITQEFGTIPGILVASSVVFENAANNLARHTPLHERTGRWVRNAFYVPKVQWKRDVLKNGEEWFGLALEYMKSQ